MVATPLTASLAVSETSTGEGHHEAGASSTVCGRCVSMRTNAVLVASTLPARSTDQYSRALVPSAEKESGAV